MGKKSIDNLDNNVHEINIDTILKKCVDDIWEVYDTDGNNTLDKEECKKFMF